MLAAVAASVALLCVGVAVRSDVNGPPSTEMPMTLLVEGRVAAKVPAQWVVRRITSGPGSARVQVMAPDGATAVLITQSQVRKGESMSATAATLRRALDDQAGSACSSSSIRTTAGPIDPLPHIGNSAMDARSTGRCSSTTPCGSPSVAKARRAARMRCGTSARRPFGRRTQLSDSTEPNGYHTPSKTERDRKTRKGIR